MSMPVNSSSAPPSYSRSSSVSSVPSLASEPASYTFTPPRPSLTYANSFPQAQNSYSSAAHHSQSQTYSVDPSYVQHQRHSIASSSSSTSSVPRSMSRASNTAYTMTRTASPVRQQPPSLRANSVRSAPGLSTDDMPQPIRRSSTLSQIETRQHVRHASTDSSASVSAMTSSFSLSTLSDRSNASATVSEYERKKALKNLETSVPRASSSSSPKMSKSVENGKEKKKSRLSKVMSFIAPQQSSSPPVYGATPVSYIVTSTSMTPAAPSSRSSPRTVPADSHRLAQPESAEVLDYNFSIDTPAKSPVDDESDDISIRSSASSMSKAIRRLSSGLTMRRPSRVSSVTSLNETSSVASSSSSSVRGGAIQADDEDEASQFETVRVYEPVKKPDFVPKSILKSMFIQRLCLLYDFFLTASGLDSHQGQVTSPSTSPASDASENLPGLTRESSPQSHSSSWTSLVLGNASAPPSPTSISAHGRCLSQTSTMTSTVQFSPSIKIYSTWNSGEYDRKIPDPVPYNTFPMWMIAQIKDEINNFKSTEMEVHESSKCYTCYY